MFDVACSVPYKKRFHTLKKLVHIFAVLVFSGFKENTWVNYYTRIKFLT